jgi:Calx-beta domain
MSRKLRSRWVWACLASVSVLGTAVSVRQAIGRPAAQTNTVRANEARAEGANVNQSQPLAHFATSALTISRNMNEAVLRVQLSSPAESVISVEYRTVDGSARSGVDYVAAHGTLTFPVGSQSQSIKVSLLSNERAHANRSLTIALGGAGEASTNRSSAKVTVATGSPNILCINGCCD